jgi:hypothetical protein
MPAPVWTNRPKAFYPRITYGGAYDFPTIRTIDFVNPAHIPEVPAELAVQAQNFSLFGYMETLYIRDEVRVHLLFRTLSVAQLNALRLYWHEWGKYGRQATLVLDRTGGAAGQYEYDQFNTFFNRAECVQNPFALVRTVIGDTIYTYDVMFRQGAEGY